MRVRAVPRQKCPRTGITAQPIDVGNASSKYRTSHRQFACAREKAARDGQRCQSMSDEVHGYVGAFVFDGAERPLLGTSNFSARGTILNSTGRRASGSPSTCA